MLSTELHPSLEEARSHDLYLGTSSWKYPGWLGQIYEEQRYDTRGKFSKAKFEAGCLAEYAETFSTVCLDAGYYAFPKAEWLMKLASLVPDRFRFGIKVTDEMTIKRFPRLPRFGKRGGEANPSFLDADKFLREFLMPCQAIQPKVGVLIFSFSHFSEGDFQRGREFMHALDQFLGQLPRDFQYSVEIRNKNFLHPEYFAMLASHGVAHCYNSWERMIPVGDQMEMPGSQTSDFVTARFLLRPGRAYAEAVSSFQPYTVIKAPYPEGRAAASALVNRAVRLSKPRRLSFIYLNNRWEGNAPVGLRDIMTGSKMVQQKEEMKNQQPESI